MANARLESKPKPGPPVSNTTWWTDRRLRWHASPVASLDDLPPPIKAALVEQLKPGETIRQIISAPRQHVLGMGVAGWRRWLAAVLPWDWTPDWTLVVTNSRLLAAASTSADDVPVVTATPIADLLSFELGTILLFSWFDWTWANEGRLERQRIYFNTVSDRLFWDALLFLRRSLISGRRPAASAGRPRPGAPGPSALQIQEPHSPPAAVARRGDSGAGLPAWHLDGAQGPLPPQTRARPGAGPDQLPPRHNPGGYGG